MMKANSTQLCRCQSGEEYSSCCQPLHRGGQPPSALALMRSRYSAYALGDADYIIKTTHANNPQAHLPPSVQKKQIEQFCHDTEFKGLEILGVQEGTLESTVIFRAILSQNQADCSFVEKSLFKNENDYWFYLKGEVLS